MLYWMDNEPGEKTDGWAGNFPARRGAVCGFAPRTEPPGGLRFAPADMSHDLLAQLFSPSV